MTNDAYQKILGRLYENATYSAQAYFEAAKGAERVVLGIALMKQDEREEAAQDLRRAASIPASIGQQRA